MATSHQAEGGDSERTPQLSAFSGARDEYLAAFRRVPPEAVGFRKEGDDYSLGGIAVHVNYVLEHYSNVLNAVIAGDFAECRPEDPPELQERARSRAGSAMAYDEVVEELERTHRLHLGVAGIVEAMPAGPERKAPVWYVGAAEAYPTSVADILGWLSDHYREHIPHLEALATEWRATSPTALDR